MGHKWTRLTPGSKHRISIRAYRRTNMGSERSLRHLIGVGVQRGLSLLIKRWVRLTNAEALAFARQLPEVVALVNWVNRHRWVEGEGGRFCPDCGIMFAYEQHADDCALDGVLAPFEETK